MKVIDPIIQLHASESNLEYLFKYLLTKIKDFKYQITFGYFVR